MPKKRSFPRTLVAIWVAAISTTAIHGATPCTSYAPQRVAIPPEPTVVEAEPLVVRFATMDEQWGKGKPVAGVDIEVGVGCANALNTRPIQRGTTNASGLVDMRISWALIRKARATGESFWARAAGPGWMRQTRRISVKNLVKPVDIRVLAQPGWTVQGRMLNQAADPVTGEIAARPVLVDAVQPYAHGSVCDHGWFELHASHEGVYEVLGRADSAWSLNPRSLADESLGVLRGVRIDRNDLANDLTLQLAGVGILRGRVRTSTGEPVAGLKLELSLSRLSAASVSESEERGRYISLRWEGAGGCNSRLRTSDDGSFEARGLRAESFEVRIGQGSEAGLLGTFASDGKPIELIVDHPHLVVHVLDECGMPWSAQQARRASSSRRWPEEWPKSPRLHLTESRRSSIDAGWAPFVSRDLPRGMESESGGISYDVVPGSEYVVDVIGGNAYSPPRVVRIPDRPGRTDVTLQLGPAPELGTVSLTIPPAGVIGSAALEVRIEDAETGRIIYRRDEYAGERMPLVMKLPAGGYRVAVEGRHVPETCFGLVMSRRRVGMVEADLSVVAGESTALLMQVPAGARINLRLAGEVNDSDRSAIREEHQGFVANNEDRFVQRALCRLLSPGRRPRVVEFMYDEGSGGNRRSYLGYHLPIGTRQISEIVPAGTYTLVAQMPGGRTESVEVSLVDGVTTPVELVFSD